MAIAEAHLQFRRSMLECYLFSQQLFSENGAELQRTTHITSEAIFLNAYVAMERLLESTFMYYAQGEASTSGFIPVRFLQPISEQHAYDMVKSSQNFLDWTSPDIVANRCATYFQNGDPIKPHITSRMDFLKSAKRLRNYIAHRSRESQLDYKKVINAILPTPPLTDISCGQFLCMIPTSGSARKTRVILYFLNGISDFGDSIV